MLICESFFFSLISSWPSTSSMLFVVFVAMPLRDFLAFFPAVREWLISKWWWQERRWSAKKKIKKEKGNNSSSSSSQPHAGDNCFSQTLKLCDFWHTLLVVLPDISLISTLIEIFWRISTVLVSKTFPGFPDPGAQNYMYNVCRKLRSCIFC